MNDTYNCPIEASGDELAALDGGHGQHRIHVLQQALHEKRQQAQARRATERLADD